MTTEAQNYNGLAKAFHWIVLMLMIGQFVTIWIAQIALKSGEAYVPFAYATIGLHKTFGLVVFLVAAARLIWRHVGGLPAWAPGLHDWEKSSAHTIENALYGLMFFLPVSGLIYSATAGVPTDFFGLFTVPAFNERSVPLANTAYFVHMISVYAFVIMLSLHLGMVIRRNVFEKGRFITRMLPGRLA